MTNQPQTEQLLQILSSLPQEIEKLRISLERALPPAMPAPDFESADGFLWQTSPAGFQPVPRINRLPIELLIGIERQIESLTGNTWRYACGFAANNALLWGTRGMGKSSLVKSAHAAVNERLAIERPDLKPLKLVEIHREDIDSLPTLMGLVRATPYRFIVFCDDLSFDGDDTSYKSLKAVLEGGIEGRPDNVLFYATSNRRHLLPRDMMDNERSTAINPGEAVEEKVSLSDRFGLWLGFHKCSQDEYLEMVFGYALRFALEMEPDRMRAEALEWSTTRGSRSGRVAWQYIQDVAGRFGRSLTI
jgi:predicted AAA+ superfamily ATPase